MSKLVIKIGDMYQLQSELVVAVTEVVNNTFTGVIVSVTTESNIRLGSIMHDIPADSRVICEYSSIEDDIISNIRELLPSGKFKRGDVVENDRSQLLILESAGDTLLGIVIGCVDMDMIGNIDSYESSTFRLSSIEAVIKEGNSPTAEDNTGELCVIREGSLYRGSVSGVIVTATGTDDTDNRFAGTIVEKGGHYREIGYSDTWYISLMELIEVDTPVWVKDIDQQSWNLRYFSDYRNDKVYTFVDGYKSEHTDVEISWSLFTFTDPTPVDAEAGNAHTLPVEGDIIWVKDNDEDESTWRIRHLHRILDDGRVAVYCNGAIRGTDVMQWDQYTTINPRSK